MDAETIKKAVKRLEWRKDPDGDFEHWWGGSAFGPYGIIVGREWLIQHPLGMRLNTGHDTLEGAKAAAQADYEARIISALSPEFLSALDTQSSRTEAMRKALEFYADPQIYQPHPHGIGFDRRDKSYHAKAVLESLSTPNPGDADGWRAIETAPKDGEFIVYGSYLYPDDTRITEYMAVGRSTGKPEYPIETHDGEALLGVFSHWRPLPAPPASSLREGRKS